MKRDDQADSGGTPVAAPEVAVFGEWNTANLGDRAIGRAARAFCAECGWRATPYALGSLRRVAWADAVSVSRSSPTLHLRALAFAPRRSLRALRQRYRSAQLAAPLERVRAIMVGGGDLLSDSNLHFPQSLAAVARLAATLGKPLMCLGCSATGPWSAHGERLLRDFLGSCTLLGARDAHTAARVRALTKTAPLTLFGDFCVDEYHLEDPADSGRDGVALNVFYAPAGCGFSQAHYEDAVISLGRVLVRRGEMLRVFTTGTAQDTAAAQRVSARLGCPALVPAHLAELESLLRASSLVVASRLHAAVLGLAQGAAVLSYSPSAKVANYLETMGLGEYVFGLEARTMLLHCVAHRGYGELRARQRAALRGAAVWAGRAAARRHMVQLARNALEAARV